MEAAAAQVAEAVAVVVAAAVAVAATMAAVVAAVEPAGAVDLAVDLAVAAMAAVAVAVPSTVGVKEGRLAARIVESLRNGIPTLGLSTASIRVKVCAREYEMIEMVSSPPVQCSRLNSMHKCLTNNRTSTMEPA